jgi:REP element-mobilizing transposase RayT
MATPSRQRKEHRLPGYDYSQAGSYFLTLCTQGRACILASVDKPTELSVLGVLVRKAWLDLPGHYRNVELDEFVVMPNHLHAIVNLKPMDKAYALGTVIQGFKAYTAREINRLRNEPGAAVWQRNYHDRVIRDAGEFDRIREYIKMNPSNWMDDENNLQQERLG